MGFTENRQLIHQAAILLRPQIKTDIYCYLLNTINKYGRIMVISPLGYYA